jgi:hypothetical protein
MKTVDGFFHIVVLDGIIVLIRVYSPFMMTREWGGGGAESNKLSQGGEILNFT